MFCGNCGSELKDTDKFCGNCGTEVPSTKIENVEEQKAQVFANSMSKIIDTKIDITKPAEDLEYTHIKKKKKRMLPVMLIIIGVMLLSVSLYVFINKDKIFYSKDGKRTIMIYMIGSDLESKYLSATKDINEILDSNINFEDVNILIYTGGAKKWHIDEIPNDKQALFEINEEGLKKIDEFDSTKDMLDYSNITYLLDYGYEHYETEFYDLILWDHGAGPIYGYGYDEYNKIGTISVEDLENALKNSHFNGGNKLELIGFDACLMSSVEIASVLSDYSEYMVASQETEPGAGWNYKYLSKVDADTSSLEMGKLIVDYYDDFYAQKKYITGVSLSLLKLNKVENVENAIDNLFANMDEKLIDEFSTFSRTRSKSKTFGRIEDEYYYYDLVDLKDFIDNLPEEYYEEVNSLNASLEDFVIYQKTDILNTYGVSVFFPYENKREIENNMMIYSSIDFVPTYYDFVDNFVEKLIGKRLQNWNLTKNKVVAQNEGKVSVTLPKDVVDNYSSASYILFDKDDSGLFTPIFNSTDVIVEGNTLSTTVAKKSLVATNSLGDEMIVTAIISEEGKNYVKYNIPATLSKWDKDKFDYEMMSVYLEFVVDEEHPNGYVATVLPMNVNENFTYRKTEIDIKEWDTLQILSFKYNILDKSGKYITNWADSNTLVSIEFDTDEDLNLEFRDLDIANDYYCVFKVKDSQGNSYYTNIVKVNNK